MTFQNQTFYLSKQEEIAVRSINQDFVCKEEKQDIPVFIPVFSE